MGLGENNAGWREIGRGADQVRVRVVPNAVDLSDLVITRTYNEGWVGAADGETVVLIDTRITPELRNEGLAREIVHKVQGLRKGAGLDIADRIRLSLVADSATLRAAIDQFRDYIASETRAVEVVGGPLASSAGATVEFDGGRVTIALEKRGGG